MTVNDVLRVASEQGVFFYLKDKKLAYKAKKNTLSTELKQKIVDHRHEIIDYLENNNKPKKRLTLPPVEKADRSQSIPLSYAQQRLWFIDQLGDGSIQYNLTGHFVLQGKFKVTAFKKAVNSLLQRHEVLRTHYKTVNGEAQQVAVEDFVVPIERHDLSKLSDDIKAIEAESIIHVESEKAFDLSKDLMIRISLIKLSNTHHIISYAMHHISSDGWSRGILENELSVLYSAYSNNLANPLPPLRIQYADYAVWQRQWLRGDILEEALSYWKDQLANLPMVHSLPLDKPRPVKQQFKGKLYHLELDASLARQIVEFNQKHNTTLFMFMHTAMSVLLSRYSGEKDIIVGSANTGRSHKDVEGLIGFFINDIVLRTDLSGTPSFTELLEKHKQTILDAYTYQHVPFEMLVEKLNPERSLSHSPLFQIKLDVQNNEQGNLSLEGLERINTEASNSTKGQAGVIDEEVSIKHDLHINVLEQSDTIALSWRYSTALFSDDTIIRLATNFCVLLKNLLDSPQEIIHSLKILDSEQERELLNSSRGVQSSYPEGKCVHELIELQVAKTPNDIAVIYGEEVLTYQQLNHSANQLAHYLIDKQVKPGHLIGLCLERSIDMLVGLLAVLKSGAAYVPLDPHLPQARLNTMLDDSNCRWVFTQTDLLSELSFGDRKVLPIDTEFRTTLLSGYSHANPEIKKLESASSNLAYVIYTSGSTGIPKGVMVEHDGLVRYCDYALNNYYSQELIGSLVATSFSFDLTVPSLYVPLLSGGAVNLLSERSELEDLAEQIVTAKRPFLLRLTPSHLAGIMPMMEKRHSLTREQHHCPHVFIIGGEPLPVSTFSTLKNLLPNAKLYNHYGPSEGIVGCSIYPLSEKMIISGRRYCPIGRAMSNTSLLVLNEGIQLNPVGVPGELFIGGKGLARGYLNRPAMTAIKFVNNPFDDNMGSRLYRTGDLVRQLPDGNLEFIGRLDDQVKVRGLRIELGEIEQSLLVLEGVQECATAVIERADENDSRIVAYVVLEKSLGASLVITEEEDEASLIRQKNNLIQSYREQLSKHLPDYMVPQVYLFIEKLPVNANGKLDRLSLPMPEESDLIKSLYVAPGNEIEKDMCELWQEVLQIKQIGVNDNFFLLGGHSLLATRLNNLIRQKFNIEFSLRVLFEKPTIAGLAREIEEQDRPSSLSEITKINRNEALSLSYSQQRLWFIDQLGEGSVQYNQTGHFLIDGKFNTPAFEQALRSLIVRHEVLRTHFKVIEGEPKQSIIEDFELPFAQNDLSSLSDNDKSTRVRQLIDEDASHPFDLNKDLMLRVKHLMLSNDIHLIIYTMHHIASDGGSKKILQTELSELYEAYCNNKINPLSDLKIQYADYAHWQRLCLQESALNEQLDYWVRHLDGMPEIHAIPLDRARPTEQNFIGKHVQRMIDKQTYDEVNDLCKKYDVTLFMFLQTVFSLLLGRYSNQTDIIMGTPIAGRTHRDVEGLIGLFVNSLIMRTDLSGNPDFIRLLQANKQVILDAYEHQDIPFEMLVEKLSPERHLNFNPLFQVMIVFPNNHDASLSKNNNYSTESMAPNKSSANNDSPSTLRTDLDLYFVPTGTEIQTVFKFNDEIFDKSTIDLLSEQFIRLIKYIVRSPEKNIAEYHLDDDKSLTLIAKSEYKSKSDKTTRSSASFHQERLWFIDKFERGVLYKSGPIYHNIPSVLDIKGEVDPDRVEKCVNQLLNHHEVFRSQIIEKQEQVSLKMMSEISIKLDIEDFSDTNPTSEDIIEMAIVESKKSFDFEATVLFRMKLYVLSEQESVLLFSTHHMIADRKSVSLFIKAFLTMYNNDESEPGLRTESARHYQDFASLQKELVDQDHGYKPHLIYWRSHLKGNVRPLEIPTDFSRKAIHEYEEGRFQLDLPKRLVTSIDRLSISSDVSKEVFLLSAFKTLLKRYSLQDEIVVGVVAENRDDKVTKDSFGPFSSLLVARDYLHGNDSFTGVLKNVAGTYGNALKYKDIPFDYLVQQMSLNVDMSRTALFDVLFQFESEEQYFATGLCGTATVKVIETNLGYGKYDLNLLVQESNNGYRLTITYNQQLYKASTIAQMFGQFRQLLTSIVDYPDLEISKLKILSDRETSRQLKDWNLTDNNYSTDRCIHQFFEEQVENNPHATALVYQNNKMSYGALNQRANQLANYLISLGVEAETKVALCVERTPDTIIGLLGILKAGGAYVPVDPSNPLQRLSYMINDSETKIVVSQSNLNDKLVDLNLDFKPHIVWLDTDSDSQGNSNIFANQLTTNIHASKIGLKPENLAYVIYTSGTSGNPKGVLVEHSNITRLFHTTNSQFNFNQNDVWTLFHSYAFDFSVWEIWGALSHGAKLIIVPTLIAQSPADFYELLIKERVSVLNQTPTMFSQIIERDAEQLKPLSLRSVILGGEALDVARLAPWFERHSDKNIQVVNMYGITETTVHVTYRRIYQADLKRSSRSIIGCKLADLELYLLDEKLSLVPKGVVAEMYVGGPGLARGYLNQKELNQSRFIEHPFKPKQRLYRTGDLGRYLDDGELEYIGRIDDQVKIRGFRIEPGEIEATILRHKNVRDVVVLAKTNEHGEKHLIAYVVEKSSNKTIDTSTNKADSVLSTIDKIRNFAQAQLPVYMMPSFFISLERFPQTNNGKLDRQALPEPKQNDLGKESYVAPRNEVEEKLAEIWQDVLKIKRIGVYDNFFFLGGHSLLATRLVSSIRQEFEIELPIKSLFESPTIASLSTALKLESHDFVLPPVKAVSRNQVLPLSYAQQRLWFVDLLGEGSVEYNMSGRFILDGAFNRKAFSRALNSLLDRHEVLRTHFVMVEGEANQVIANRCELPFTLHDLSEMSVEQQQQQAIKLMQDEVKVPFDLGKDLMLRVVVLKFSETKYLVVYTIHHIAGDGWSLTILNDELLALYDAYCDQKDNPLEPLDIQYVDYAIWQRDWLKGQVLEKQLDYWRNQLAGIPQVHKLPLDKARPTEQLYEGRAFSQIIDKEITSQIKKLCNQFGVTLYMFLETAFAVLIGRYSQEQDIVLGSPIAGRTHKDIEKLIGFFVNTLVVRTKLSGNLTFSQLLEKNKQTILDAYANQHIPFEMLVEEVRPERNMSYSSLFQILFVVQNNESEAPGLEVESGHHTNRSDFTPRDVNIRFDLALHVAELNPELLVSWSYRDSLFEDETVARMATNFNVLLESIIDGVLKLEKELPIEQLNIISDEERNTLLVDWNDTYHEYNQTLCVHELFEQQVERTPDNIAVIYEDKKLSYRELNQQANCLAHFLIEKGVKPDSVVALSLNHSLETMVGLLGVLKSGAGYVPLEPSCPASRMAYMLDDCGAKILITQSGQIEGLSDEKFQIIYLDDKNVKNELSRYLDSNPQDKDRKLTSSNLAYVIYTSGSTGKPKGVMINHNSVCNFLNCAERLFLTDKIKGSIVSSPITFDATVQSLYLPLITGRSTEFLKEGDELLSTLADYLIDDEESLLFKITPTHLKAVSSHSFITKNPSVEHVIVVAGEQLTKDTLQQWKQEILPNAHFINEYGPTEGTVGSCIFAVPDAYDFSTNGPGVPIGKPLDNVKFYVLGQHRELQPVGVCGELYIGGDGLAREYLNRPQLTDSRFINHSFSTEPTDLLYRTGDLVRWLPDGNLEFVGRVDDQVKIRGFRIELGEIEGILNSQQSLNSSVVIVNKKDQDSQLVAYVCPSTKYLTEFSHSYNQEHLDRWTLVNDDKYADTSNNITEVESNFFGWNSSYTDKPIALEQMEEWLSGIMQRIHKLNPKRLLEIGCGQGLLLYRYAETCEAVYASDISSVALSGIQKELDGRGWGHVTLEHGDALSIDKFNGAAFDTVVINSVVQYFPNRLYLQQMLDGLLSRIDDGGKILVGDVRNLDLFTAHLAAIEKSHLGESTPVSLIANRVQRRIQQEPELLISPSFFAQLADNHPEIDQVDILVKRGVADNELLRYRYDVVITKKLKKATENKVTSEVSPLIWNEFKSTQSVLDMLQQNNLDAFGVYAVPNARIEEDIALSTGFGEWESERLVYPQKQVGSLNEAAITQIIALESLLSSAEKEGYYCAVTWSQDKLDHLDLIFSRDEIPEIQARSPYVISYLTNHPQMASVGHDLSRELKQKLELCLPDYMVPSVYIVMENLPMTTSGKIDKRALPLPEEGDLQKNSYVAPRSESEQQLAELWQQLLNIEQVGINDNFFALGGHSLLATRLVSLIRQSFRVELPLRSLFDSPTIAELSERLATESTDFVLPPLVKANRTQSLPLSYAQQRLWFIDQLDPGAAQYNMPGRYLVQGDFDLDAFKRAVKSLLDRHEVLRTHFTMEDGEPRQIIADEYDFPFTQHDLSELSETKKNSKIRRLINEEVKAPFNLNQDLMLRVRLIKLSADVHLILYTMHHIASDGWSVGILRDELSALYTAYSDNQKNPLAELKYQYADYSLWQRGWLQGELLNNAISYWRNQLSNIPLLHSCPLDKPRPSQQTFSGKVYRQILDESTTESIRSLCEQNEVTLFMFLQTAFAVLLGRYSNETDIVMGTPVAGRNHADIEPLIGFFINTLVIRTDLSKNPTFTQLLKKNKETILDAYENQYIPFEMLVDELQPERDMSHNPVIQILFVVQNTKRGTLDLHSQSQYAAGANQLQTGTKSTNIKFDLELNVHEQGNKLSVSWGYNESLFEEQTISSMSANYSVLLTNIIQSLSKRIKKSNTSPEDSSTLKSALLTKLDWPFNIDKPSVDNTNVSSKDLEYRRRQLADLPAKFPVPADRLRVDKQAYQSDRLSQLISRPLSIKLQSFSRQHGVSYNATLLAAFGVLIGRYAEQNDVAIVVPVNGEVHQSPHKDSQPSHSLVRMDLSGTPTFVDVVQKVFQTMLKISEDKIESLEDWLHLRNGELSSMFQVSFSIDKPQRMPMSLSKIKSQSGITSLTGLYAQQAAQNFELAFSISENMKGTCCAVNYNAERFEVVTIDQLLIRYVGLLDSVAEVPESLISELDLPEERVFRLDILSKTETDFLTGTVGDSVITRRENSVHGLFESQAAKVPEEVVLTQKELSFNYRELNERANQLANYLISLGVMSDTKVGVCINDDVDMFIGTLGILKAGGCYVPLQQNCPELRLTHILEESGVQLIVTKNSDPECQKICGLVDILPNSFGITRKIEVVNLDTCSQVCSSSNNNPNCAVSSSNMAYINYFSVQNQGVQGITLTHRALLELVVSELPMYLQVDYSNSNRYISPIATEAQKYNWEAALLPSNDYLVSDHKKGRIIDSNNMEITAPNCGPRVGSVLASSEQYVLNDDYELTPLGGIGELYVGGEQMSRGYLNKKALTAEHFVPHAYGREPGKRLYRTGELVRRLRNGRLEFQKCVNKNNGWSKMKFASAKTEQLISSFESIKDAAVIDQKESPQPLLVSYVVTQKENSGRKEAKVSLQSIQRNIRQQLRLYPMPAVLVELDEMPVAENGLLDLKLLPKPNSLSWRQVNYVEPANDIQRFLCDIWQRELKIEKIGIHDNFFSLGGHSLIATRLVSMIREELGVELQIRALFESPTVAGICESLDAANSDFVLPSIVSAERYSNESEDMEEVEF